MTLIFGSTQINAIATNKEGTEIRNCEFQFETSGTAVPQIDPKVEEQKEHEVEDQKEKPELAEQFDALGDDTKGETSGEITFEQKKVGEEELNHDLTT